MSEPEKPFACVIPDCGMTFTNEDHLNVHTKKHDMVLQLGQKGVGFVADQTPTPTRFIRNCEEVGLFQDLQNVNPFDETFKRAMETRVCSSSLETMDVAHGDDVLHTPHIFPHLSDDSPTTGYTSGGQADATDDKGKDAETSAGGKPAKDACTVTTAQKHNLAVQKGQLTHSVDASLRLPVISISETDDNGERSSSTRMRCTYSSKNDILLTYSSRPSAETLRPPSPEGHLVQLISQKSIEQALENFTREHPHHPVVTEKRVVCSSQKVTVPKIKPTEDKLVKLVKNIPIEGNTRLKRQNPDTTDVANNTVHREKRPEKPDSTSLLHRLGSWADESSQHDNSANGAMADGGYELLLKLPNGKKIFLREDRRAERSQNDKMERTKTIRELLKDAIVKGKVKRTTIQPIPALRQEKLPLPANPRIFIVPQNVKYVQGILATETIAKAQVLGVVDSNRETKIGKPAQIKPTNLRDANPTKAPENAVEKDRQNGEEKSPSLEPQMRPKSTQNKEWSPAAAAGRRYRHRKKETLKRLLDQNRKLQSDNEAMSRQLISSMIEIKRLRELLNTQHGNTPNKQQARGFVVQNPPKNYSGAQS